MASASISTDILGIIALSFTFWLVRKNKIFDSFRTRSYVVAAVATVVILFMEIITVIIPPGSGTACAHITRFADLIGFAVCPIVPLSISTMNMRHTRSNQTAIILLPFCINLFFCLISLKTGWIYSVTANNVYIRGPLFIIPTVICAVYCLMMAFFNFDRYENFDAEERHFLLAVFSVIAVAAATQIIFSRLLIIWSSVSVCLLLYYIFLRELQFTYDVLTNIKNRAAFEKAMSETEKSGTYAILVMLDLNNFKSINDESGHAAGDNALRDCADAIKSAFKGIGIPYRIGGDEFCVICKDCINEQVLICLRQLDEALLKSAEICGTVLELAHGSSVYDPSQSESIYSVLSLADQKMYLHKQYLKTGE